MRHSIRTKVILLGSITSFLMIGLALLISFFVYQNRAYKNLENKVDSSIKSIIYSMEDDDLEFLDEIYERVEAVFKESSTDPSFDNYEDKLAYYTKKYDFIYPVSGGLGLSYDAARLRNKYLEISNDLKSSVISSGGLQSFIAYQNNGKIVYLVDSNFNFEKVIDKDMPLSSYCFLGSYYEFTENDGVIDDISELDGVIYYTLEFNGFKHRVAAVNPTTENSLLLFIKYDEAVINSSITQFFVTELIGFSIVLVVLIVFFGLLSHYLITRNVIRLNDSTTKFTKNLSNNKIEVINPNIKSSDEVRMLSDSFVALEQELIKYVDQVEKDTKEKERINAELEIASSIQLGALPTTHLNDKNVLIRTSIESAKEVGGDFYDYFYIDDNHLAIIISDVSGKGVPAALFMMKSKELIRSKLLSNEKLDKVCFDVNNALLYNNSLGLFITAFIGILDIDTNILSFVNCGHERPYIINDKEIKRLEVNANFILGGIDNFEYKVETIKLSVNDKLFLHTDGLNEAINNQREEFGYDRIKNVLESNKTSQIGDVLTNMSNELKNFVANEEKFDDVTMMIIEIKSSKLSFNFIDPNYEIIDIVNNKLNDYYSYIDKKVLSESNIIFDEILNNYISYEKKEGLIINILINIDKDMFVFEFSNNGVEFNPLNEEMKYIESYDENMPIGGLGLSLIKSLSNDVKYERKDDMNYLTIKKKIS